MYSRKWLALLLALTGWLTPASASGDARFVVTMPLEAHTSWQSRVDDGMSQVLDRLLLQRERGHLVLKGTRYLERATPTDKDVRLVFRAAAVIAALQRRGLHPIASPPRLVLRLAMQDTTGQAMPQTVTLLRDEANRIAQQWGINLRPSASEQGMRVGLAWQWVDDHWLALVVEADDPSLVALGGENRVDGETPMAQLRQRLYRILLRARDLAAAATETQTKNQHASTAAPSAEPFPNTTITLSIMRPAPLAEQVGLEQVLQAVPQVKALTPLLLSRQWQRYRLQVTDAQWITGWFARRGMRAIQTNHGWEVR